METISLNCANCGAPLSVADYATTVTCEHCGAKLGIKYDDGESPRDSADRTTPDKEDAPSSEEKPRARTEVLEVVKAGVEVIGAGVKVVDRVSSVFFWTKVTIVAIVVICVFVCCVVPSLVFFGLFSERFRDTDEAKTNSGGTVVEEKDQSGNDAAGGVEKSPVVNDPVPVQAPMDLGKAIAQLNHPDPRVRDQADKVVRRLDADPELMVRQCLEDLNSDERKSAALGRLASLEIAPPLHKSVVAAVGPLIRRHQLPEERVETLDVLAKCFPLGIPKMVEAMQNLAYRREAVQRLRQAGPVVETFVWVALKNDDYWLHRDVCELLAEIGTERSIPQLKSLAQTTNQQIVTKAARSAIGAIVAANRQPVDVPAAPKLIMLEKE